MNWLQHPDIYMISVAIALINILALAMCVIHGSRTGIVVNSAALIINTAGALGNYLLRPHRRQLQLAAKAERRQHLIDGTIGH